jgi:hypothetical protein
LDAAKVAVEDAKAATAVAEAQVAQIEATIADMTLRAPVSGRIEYRLAQTGEVVGAGGRVLTLPDLSDAHMAIWPSFCPTADAGRVELGSEARIVLDSAIIPATVSFVAADAQFTPKYVETVEEREKDDVSHQVAHRPTVRGEPSRLRQGRNDRQCVCEDTWGAPWPISLTRDFRMALEQDSSVRIEALAHRYGKIVQPGTWAVVSSAKILPSLSVMISSEPRSLCCVEWFVNLRETGFG